MRAENTALESGKGDGVLFADDVVGAARAVGGEVAVARDVAVQALVSPEITTPKDYPERAISMASAHLEVFMSYCFSAVWPFRHITTVVLSL